MKSQKRKLTMKVIFSLSTLIVLFFVCCSQENNKQKNKNPYQIIANNEDIESFIWFNDSTADVYNFHPNRKLKYYLNSQNGEIENEAIYFFENGCVESILNFKNSKRHGIAYHFYLSGNIKSIKHFNNDSLRGYYVDYYDKFNCKKAEYFASPNSKQSYIYMRTYDSSSQKVISVLDHRQIEIEEFPELKMEDLKMPWEK